VRTLAKRFLDWIAAAIVSPVAVHFFVWAYLRRGHRDQVFQGHSQLMSLLPGITGNFLRRAFYKLTLLDCAPDCCISFGTTFATPDVSIGRGVYIGTFCNIGHADIGPDVLIGTGVMITSGRQQHYFSRLDIAIRLQGGENARVTIGRDCWLGNGAVVMADLAEQSIVSAGSVVTHAAAPRSILTGNPARVVAVREHRHGSPRPE
jgi:virginiamycin A acetyltransferase